MSGLGIPGRALIEIDARDAHDAAEAAVELIRGKVRVTDIEAIGLEPTTENAEFWREHARRPNRVWQGYSGSHRAS